MIGPGTTIKGQISGDEDLHIEGRVEGAIRITQALTVAEGAVLVADIQAQSVNVSGRITGDVDAPDGILIDGNAVVVGDLTTTRLSIAEGARFKGRINMDFEVPDAPNNSGRRR